MVTKRSTVTKTKLVFKEKREADIQSPPEKGQKSLVSSSNLGRAHLEVRFDHFISRDTMNGSQGRHEIQTVFGVLRRSVEALDTECSKLKSSVDGTAGRRVGPPPLKILSELSEEITSLSSACPALHTWELANSNDLFARVAATMKADIDQLETTLIQYGYNPPADLDQPKKKDGCAAAAAAPSTAATTVIAAPTVVAEAVAEPIVTTGATGAGVSDEGLIAAAPASPAAAVDAEYDDTEDADIDEDTTTIESLLDGTGNMAGIPTMAKSSYIDEKTTNIPAQLMMASIDADLDDIVGSSASTAAAATTVASVAVADSATSVEAAAAAVAAIATPLVEDVEDDDDFLDHIPSLQDFGMSAATLAALDGARSTAVPAMPTMPELSLSSALNMEPPSVADDVIAAPALASAAAGGVAPHVPAAALTAHAAPIMAPAVLSLSALPKHLNMPTGRPAVEIATPDLDTSLDLTMYNITSVALMDATTAPSPAAAADEGEEAEGVVDESFAEPREDAELPQVDVQEEGGAEEQDAAGAAGTAEQPAALVVDELSVSEIFAPVTDEEYGKMPHYFSLTLSLENLNDAIAAIEDCITETDAPISEVVFTQTQLKEDLGLGAAAKPVLLILIKLKRLESKAKSEDGETFYCFKTTR